MQSTFYHYKSSRARLARLAIRLNKFVRMMLVSGIVLLIIGGLILLMLKLSVGWFVGSLAVPFIMILTWHHRYLQQIPSSTNGIDGLLASDILGQLSENPTPKEIAKVASSVKGGQFFAVRFGITLRILDDVSSDSSSDTERIWQLAQELRAETGSDYISGAVLVVALMLQRSDSASLLAHMHLDREDLLAGIRWYEQLRLLIQQTKKPRRTGGIARDFSFGYTPLLQRFGLNLSEGATRQLTIPIKSHEAALEQLVQTFSTGGRQNVALIGAEGTGKSTIVQAFAERIVDASVNIPSNLKFRQVVMLDSASLIAAAPGRGELEGLIMQILGEAYNAKNIIICLDNAQLFFEEGIGSVDLTNVLLPILEAGNLRMILTMDEQRYLQISGRTPSLANALNRITISPADRTETIAVMQTQLILTEFHRNVTFMYQSLAEAYRLSERYVHDLAMPGRAMKLLESSASFAESGFVTGNSVQQSIEQTMNIKVGVAQGEVEREKLLNLEELIHQRMINQTRAVQVVSDALRRARAGVRNENKPIGTFLFLGPTGVGKTELAKALADVYFGGEANIIRLDLNEFVRSDDVTRLIADGAEDPTSLTSQVMKKPFSVILLDEIEKAHPQVLTTLLQLLDEGILRDIKNREVSFRDAIIIATSNAGADRIREYIERGYKLADFEQQFIDELISSNQFKPEFLNRFDEVVIFRPLNKPELLQVVDLILVGINKQMALQKVSIEVADDAKELLVDCGYDPRLGARPMRRIVQRAVENLVAKQMLSGEVVPGSVIQISLEQVSNILENESRS